MTDQAGTQDTAPLRPLVFISHTGADHDLVQALAAHLQRDGCDTWVDDVDLLVGDSMPAKIAAAIAAATHFVPVLSTASVQREWVLREIDLALDRLSDTGCGFVLPCVLDECEVPASLTDIKWADFGRSGYETAYAELRERVLPAGPVPTSAQAGLKRLEAAEPWTRAAGLRELVASQHPAALAGALRALGDPEAAVRAVAVETLGAIGGEVAVEALKAATGDESSFVREAVASALGKIEPGAVISNLTPALHDADEEVQRVGTEGIYRHDRDRFPPGSFHAQITLDVPEGRLCGTPVRVESQGHSVPEERWLLCRKDAAACQGCALEPDGALVTRLTQEDLDAYGIRGQMGFSAQCPRPESPGPEPGSAAERAMRLTRSRSDGASVVVVEETPNGWLMVTGFPLARPGRWGGKAVTADDLHALVHSLTVQDIAGCPPVVLPYHPGKRNASPLRRIRPGEGGAPVQIGRVSELWYDDDAAILHCSLAIMDSGASTAFKAGQLRHVSPKVAWGGAANDATGERLDGPVLMWVAFTDESTTGDQSWVRAS